MGNESSIRLAANSFPEGIVCDGGLSVVEGK